MDNKSHWDALYLVKKPAETSWFTPHLERSKALIQQAAADRATPVIDVGCGQSTLVDDLLGDGYQHLTLLDISREALARTTERLGPLATKVEYLAEDILAADLPRSAYGVWHDRAVFHFFTQSDQRHAYVEQVASALRPGGSVVIATFALQGPLKCSGLTTQRYDAPSLQAVFGDRFCLVESLEEIHHTPFGTTQQFLFCHFKFQSE